MTVVPARPDQDDAVTGVLARAFADDPVLNWVFRRPQTVRRYGPGYFAVTVRRLAADNLTWTTDGLDGAAVWAAPGHWAVGPLDLLRLARATAPGLVPHGPRVLLGLAGIEARHPKPPHLYLATVGVEPDRRGQGWGSRLLAPGLAHADAHRLPCFLESSNPRNVPLYERHGFRTTSVVTLPGGPPVHLMWRAPAATVAPAG